MKKSLLLLILITYTTILSAFEIKLTSTGMKVIISNDEIFYANTPSLTKDGRNIIEQLIKKLPKAKSLNIIVEGHTDTKSIKDADKFRYPSNYELASFKAASVLRFIDSKKIENILSIYIKSFAGSTPLYPNYTKDGRRRNNRIELDISYEYKKNSITTDVDEAEEIDLVSDYIFKDYLYSSSETCTDIEKEYIHTLYFKDKVVALTDTQKEEVGNVVKYIKHRGRMSSLIIEAHSSSAEDILRNNVFSIERGYNLKEILSVDFKSNKIKVLPYGASINISSKNKYKARNINNRIRFSTIRCLDSYKPNFEL